MDRSAIERIEELGNAASKLPETNTPITVVPDNSTIKSLEDYQPGRSRFRGKMSTESIEDFASYTKQYSQASCFINQSKMIAVSVFNLGTEDRPGHADNKAILSLETTAAYEAVKAITNQRLSQKDLAEWLEDWRMNLEAIDQDSSDLDIKKSINAIRNITIESSRKEEHSDHDFKAGRSAMEEIEASSKENIPSSFCFTCMPYVGLSDRQFYLRLSLITGGEKPVFILRIIKHDEIKEEMTKEFKSILDDSLKDDDIKIFIGSFSA